MQPSDRSSANGTDRVVVVVDGPPEAQAWLDNFIMAAAMGTDTFPHPHPDIPRAKITRAKLWDAIAATFSVDGRPWSVPEHGYPPIESPAVAAAPPGDPDPSKGSASHNLLHRILGDFH